MLFQTTLARIIARVAKEKCGYRFVQLSATTSGVAEVKDVVKVARNERAFKRNTILFVDEIHRFNKLQQVRIIPNNFPRSLSHFLRTLLCYSTGYIPASRRGWDNCVARGNHRKSLLPAKLCPPEPMSSGSIGETRY